MRHRLRHVPGLPGVDMSAGPILADRDLHLSR